MAVFAGEGQSHIVGTNVAGVAIAERSVQPLLAVAIQAHRHRTDDLPCDGVETVAYLPMTITAQHPAL